ncbi:MAG: 3-oxoacyl-[acyl-carrier-protein] synthase, KASII (EC 2.3.1.179) [Olavius algarvensis Delta 4 endosymbiont]|nr:MAG: 3-oxoacyl-[acyl-carrier-protein] synthase, KASII (EC 2.3.1.179) [Olavius algarvensis Delta 4 endosymbiont]
MKNRVVITGVGLVTPVGVGVEESWEAICAGKSGIGPITRFDTSEFKTKIAAEVKGFDPLDFMDKKDAKRTQPYIAYAVAAAKMAMEDAALAIDDANGGRVGVSSGCGLGGLFLLETEAQKLDRSGPKRISPFFIPTIIGNMAPGMISIVTGAKGPNLSMATACAAGTHAVGEAFKIVQNGAAEAMIAGGVEAVISPCCIAGFNAMKALSTRNDDPQKASRPFDRDRDGFVVGEGSGMLILETLEGARARGAKIYAEILGYGMSGDAFHMASPPPEAEGAARCMQMALDDAELAPEKIEYINAHGTSTALNDASETSAIKKVFGDHATSLMISSTKSMTGHLLGGAGGIEAVFTALALSTGVIPPTINLENPAEGCDLDYVPNVARKKDISAAMTNSFGFGGTNAVLIMGRPV